jgi:two-component system response regulator FixJ
MTPSIFVIEDDFAVRDALVQLLRAEGLRARGFANGDEFFANLPSDPVACVVTDLRMPGMDGVEVVNRINELHGEAWPVVILTGHGNISSAVALMKAGVTDFIEKPFEPNRLIETLKGCLNRIRQVDERLKTRALIDRRLSLLTVRERQVFDQLVQGLSNKEIAANLEISPRTVEIFRAKVMAKMEATNLSALVRMSLGLE